MSQVIPFMGEYRRLRPEGEPAREPGALLTPTRQPLRIAVFRALQLGDMLCFVPALRALRRAYPRAHIALLGLRETAGFAGRFPAYIDELVDFPGIPAFPEQAPRLGELAGFFRRAHAAGYDIALQMHGSGLHSNAVVKGLGAGAWGGFVPQGKARQAGRLMPWPDDLPEARRYLKLLRFLGIPAADDKLEFPLHAQDHVEAHGLLREAGLDPARLVLLHPGARLPSRRWPPERFGQIGAALAARGWQLALTGTEGERELARRVRAAGAQDAADLCGRTSLGGMAALIAASRLLVCNDTGVSHLAAAVGTRSVVVASGSDPRRWAPADAGRHALLAAPMPCRPCAHDVCPIGHPCALRVTPDQVLAAALRQLDREPA